MTHMFSIIIIHHTKRVNLMNGKWPKSGDHSDPRNVHMHIIEQVGWSPSLSSLRVDNWSGDENPYLYSQQNVITSQHRLAGFEHWKSRHYRVRWLVSKSNMSKQTEMANSMPTEGFLPDIQLYIGERYTKNHFKNWPEQSIRWRYWDTVIIVIYDRKQYLTQEKFWDPSKGN